MSWYTKPLLNLLYGTTASDSLSYGTTNSDSSIYGTTNSYPSIYGTTASDSSIYGTTESYTDFSNQMITYKIKKEVMFLTRVVESVYASIHGFKNSDFLIYGTSGSSIYGTTNSDSGSCNSKLLPTLTQIPRVRLHSPGCFI